MIYTDKILFYIDDANLKRFTLSEVNTAYDIACETYKTENNRVLSASIDLLNKDILRLNEDFSIKKDSSGVEATDYQTISDMIETRRNQIGYLRTLYKDETNMYRVGFGRKAKKTIIDGIND